MPKYFLREDVNLTDTPKDVRFPLNMGRYVPKDPDNPNYFKSMPDNKSISLIGFINEKVAEGEISTGPQTFLDLTDTPSDYTGATLQAVRVNAAGDGLEFFTISGGTTISTYDAGNGVTITGTSGVSTTKASGEITITIPEDGFITNATIEVDPGDATYSSALLVSGGALKVVIDNSANSNSLQIHKTPVFMARTSAGAVTDTNPLQFNAAINNDSQIDEYSTGRVG